MDDQISIALKLPNQDLSVMPTGSFEFQNAVNNYLPHLLIAWKLIEKHTGYQWKATSYIRRSPNHQFGTALDLAPSFSPASEPLYAVSKLEDPTLYKRGVLLRKLQTVIPRLSRLGTRTQKVAIFVECDHLHLQFMRSSRSALVKWKEIKPAYSDSQAKQELPMIN